MSWMSPFTVPITTLPMRSRAGLGEQRPQDLHPGLHRVRGQQHLRHEQDAVAEVDAHDPHALDQRLVQHAVGGPAARQQDVRALRDLVGEPVVEVVVHLRDQLLVGQRRKIEFVVAHRALPFRSASLSALRRSPLGSKSGSVAHGRREPRARSTPPPPACPRTARRGRQVAVDDPAADRVAVGRRGHVAHDPAAVPDGLLAHHHGARDRRA